MTPFSRKSIIFGGVALLAVGGAGLVYAQLEGSDRGIPPIDSTSNFEVGGVVVDVTGENGEEARQNGWRLAQRLGWRKLWARSTGRPESEAPNLPDNVLNQIVSGIVVEDEQIGPRRYIGRIGLLFDRARTGQMLGVSGVVRRSAAMLVIPVMRTGSTGYALEYRTPWQYAWAQFRTGGSVIDYVRPVGTGMDPLLLNAAQTGRRSRGWWAAILDQYGALDVLIPEVELHRAFPGGPATARFTARFGPDATPLGSFTLSAPDGASVPRMLAEGVERLDAVYARAYNEGRLTRDGSLTPPPVAVLPSLLPPEETPEDQTTETDTNGGPVLINGQAVAPPPTPQPETAAPATFTVQVQTPDANAVERAERAVRGASGVRSAFTSSLALGGTSVMRVTYAGDATALAAALQAAGYRVQVSGQTLRISR